MFKQSLFFADVYYLKNYWRFMDKRSLLFVILMSIGLFFFNQWMAPEPNITNAIAISTPALAPNEESLYVLENGSMQIVFSNLGGAVSEINLPFEDKENPSSVVRSIRFDKQIAEESPYNTYFPTKNANRFDVEKKESVLMSPIKGGYTPLLRRDLYNNTGSLISVLSPDYYAMQIVDEMGHFDAVTYAVRHFDATSIIFEANFQGKRIIKTYELVEPYGLRMKLKIIGHNNQALYLTTGIPEVELISGSYQPLEQYLSVKSNNVAAEKIDLPTKGGSYSYSTLFPLWISNGNGFFGTIVSPAQNGIAGGFSIKMIEGETIPTRLSLIDRKYDLYPAKNYPAYSLLKAIPASTEEIEYRIFAGPFDSKVLNQLDDTFTPSPLFIKAQSFHGWFSFISEPFAKFLFFLMKVFYAATHSWGLSIIFITVVLRILMYPLNRWSTRSMAALQQIGPEVAAIQERYKKDMRRAQIEIATLYRERKVNPISGGCLPMLIQIPFLMGMFDLLKTSFELRGVPFIFPNWINNLAAPDVLFSWGYPIPFIGNEFHLLPFITAGLMFVQQRMGAWMNTQTKMSEQQRQQVAVGNIMTIVMTVVFYNFASGLNIYWIFSTLLSLIQQWTTMKKMQTPKVEVLKK